MFVVGYVRLSRDEDKENYSSIISQQDIINDYAEEKGWTISKIYIDDNCSGYTFNRYAFNEMMEDLDAGSVDIILTKDLSRIGRNNGKVLVLIDRFRELNKRLILITEGKGGLDLLTEENDILGIKTWYNEMYVKDISRKIRANMHSKQKKGELIMGNYFGYKKIKINGSFQLIVDENIKPIIQLIFRLYQEGLGYKRICDVLEEKAYPTPSEYLMLQHEEKGRVFKNAVSQSWQTYMVQRILQNDVYVGTLRTKKIQAKLIKGRQEKVARNEQYIFKNHHEAIITEEDFRLVQEMGINRNNYSYGGKSKNYNYIFGGFLQCGACGNKAIGLNLRKAPAIQRGYNCTMYQKYGKKKCSNHAVKEEKILFFYKELLKEISFEYAACISNIKRKDNRNTSRADLNTLQRELSIASSEFKLIVMQKLKDLNKEDCPEYKEIIENSYLEIENEKKKKIKGLKDKLQGLEKLKIEDKDHNVENNIEGFESIINCEIVERKDLERILDKIVINDDRTLEFKLKINIDELTI